MAAMGVDRDLELRLDAIRREHGETVHIDMIAEVVHSVLDTLTGDISGQDMKLYREVESIANYIQTAKAEIAALRPGEIKNEFIASATDELDAIVGATEAATNEIMDAAEKIESLAPMLDEQVAERLTEITTLIFEACTFQDITGQRITKVVRTLQFIESRVNAMIDIWGPDNIAEIVPKSHDPRDDDTKLLNGPALENQGISQDEIDKLFG